METRPPLKRDETSTSKDPLLSQDVPDSISSPRPSSDDEDHDRALSSSYRSHLTTPSQSTLLAAQKLRKKWLYASIFLVLSLISFVVQTETAYTVQRVLKWEKAYCMLWLTHSSWTLLWPLQLLVLRLQKRSLSRQKFLRAHLAQLRATAEMVRFRTLNPAAAAAVTDGKPLLPYVLKITAIMTAALTIAGGSWYVAIDLTTPSDLTAIYNCSAFFAYVFSVPILKERFRLDKSVSVAVAILGVLVVAYGPAQAVGETPHRAGGSGATGPDGADGGGGGEGSGAAAEAKNRLLGNVLIGIGSVLYGLYEVLYKRLACPPEGASPGRSMVFANAVGSCIGLFTFTVLWIPLPILHFTGLEVFELPRGRTAWLLGVSVLANASEFHGLVPALVFPCALSG